LAAATCSEHIAVAFWLLQLAANTLQLHFGCCNLQRTHCSCILAAASCSEHIAVAFWLLQLAANTLQLHFKYSKKLKTSFF
jgi:hypothetical protein